MLYSKKYKSMVERLYDRKCDIYRYVSSINKKGITESKREIIYENVPCRISYVISFNNINEAKESNTATGVNQKVKMFISPDVNVKEGSVVIIKSKGSEREYISSGISRVYGSHQEVVIIDGKKFA